jgi:GPH family glycoside/pentoside/hexuronide:cation symporter
MNQVLSRVSVKERVGYSLGDTASNLFFQTFMLFITYFYTDVFGITPAVVATMLLVTRIWDAFADPMMGMIADRTNTRMGKFRPFMLWFAVPFGIIGVLTFTTPNFAMTGKIIWAYVTYTLMMMMYTIVNVPYSALMGVITPNSQERTAISSYRFVAAFFGGIIVQSAVMPMVRKFGGDNQTLGWQLAMTVISLLAVVLFIITFLTTKERVQPPASQKTSFRQDLTDLVRNVPWLIIGITSVLHLTNVVIRNGSIMYYFKYCSKSISFSFLGKPVAMAFDTAATTFMLVGTAATIVGAVLATWLSRTFDKRNTFLGSLVLAILFIALFYFVDFQNYPLMLTFQILASFGLGVIAVLQWAMFTDTVDYSEWKTGRRATGLVMSASLFAIKLGLALGGAILGWLLAAFDFVPNVEQSVQTITGIRLIISVFPAIFGVICIGLMWFYPLNNQKMVEMEAELTARRK